MVSGAPDFWLKGKYIDLIDTVNIIRSIVAIGSVGSIAEISKVAQVDSIDVINALKTLEKITEITKVKRISSFGETGTLTYFSEAATADILTPTKDYRTRVLGAVVYNPTDIQAYLRWKNTGNFILGVPTLGLAGMNPMSLRHPLGAADEVLELYMSAAGTVKGWVVTEEQYSVGADYTKTITEVLGLVDTKAYNYTPAAEDYFGFKTIGAEGISLVGEDWGRITGSVFTCLVAATADTIKIALSHWTSPHDITLKLGLYKFSDFSYVGETEERTFEVNNTPTWYNFNFDAPKPSLEADTEYMIVAFVKQGRYCYCSVDEGGEDQTQWDEAINYDSFPDPLVTDLTFNYKMSIYCEYTPI